MKTTTPFGKGQCLLFMLLVGSQPLWAQQPSYVANTPNFTASGDANTLVGPYAGQTAAGHDNTLLGYSAGKGNSGNDNTFIGSNTGYYNSTGSNNTFMGYQSGYNNTQGSFNTFVGIQAGRENSTGTNNTFIGFTTGAFNIGSGNAFMGSQAGYKNTTGENNVFIGNQAGFANGTGSSNTFMGSGAGKSNTLGATNTFVGTGAGATNTSGSNNAFVGNDAGGLNTEGVSNTFMGNQAGFKNTANANTFMGFQAGYNTTTGGSNVFVGNSAGYNNTTGQGNMFLGPQAGTNNTSGSYNLFIGNGSGNSTTTGKGNTAIGDGSALHNTTGERNVFIGQYSGINNNTGGGSDNVFIGFAASAQPLNEPELTNVVVIGAGAMAQRSNTVILGKQANVGIGTSQPNAKLEIAGGNDVSGLRFTGLKNTSPAAALSQTKFLTVNASGDVILASTTSGGREGVSESLWQRKGTFLQNTNGEAIIIGSTVKQTPAGYKLFVEEGILTEKVKVAVKNTSDWSDKVFAPSYSLRSLTEVDQYITKHQHLPGVPSAIEVVEKGVDVAKMDAKLLEKIEELTLYSIQLEKARQQQQIEIDELKRLVKQLAKKK